MPIFEKDGRTYLLVNLYHRGSEFQHALEIERLPSKHLSPAVSWDRCPSSTGYSDFDRSNTFPVLSSHYLNRSMRSNDFIYRHLPRQSRATTFFSKNRFFEKCMKNPDEVLKRNDLEVHSLNDFIYFSYKIEEFIRAKLGYERNFYRKVADITFDSDIPNFEKTDVRHEILKPLNLLRAKLKKIIISNDELYFETPPVSLRYRMSSKSNKIIVYNGYHSQNVQEIWSSKPVTGYDEIIEEARSLSQDIFSTRDNVIEAFHSKPEIFDIKAVELNIFDNQVKNFLEEIIKYNYKYIKDLSKDQLKLLFDLKFNSDYNIESKIDSAINLYDQSKDLVRRSNTDFRYRVIDLFVEKLKYNAENYYLNNINI